MLRNIQLKCSRYRPGVAQRVGRGIAILLQVGVAQRVGRGIAVLLQARCGTEGG